MNPDHYNIFITPATFGCIISQTGSKYLHRVFLNENASRALADLVVGKNNKATKKLVHFLVLMPFKPSIHIFITIIIIYPF